jgi:hypothetical protein
MRTPGSSLLLLLVAVSGIVACEADSGRGDAGPVDAVDVPVDGSVDVPVDALVPDAAEPVEPAPDTVEPAPDTVEPAPDTVEPAPDTVEPAPDTVEPAPDVPDVGPEDQGGEVVDFGFDVRVPQWHDYTCEGGMMGDVEMHELDTDWICTFDDGGQQGWVYAQATPTGCFVTMGATPTYTPGGAWFSDGAKVVAVDKPAYDYGGGHHNDSLAFDWNGKHYKVYHSSFGWGWRACQNMDCLQVYGAGGALETDGCTTDRTLPVVCVQVKEDGTYDPLIDTFEKCLGDPNR